MVKHALAPETPKLRHTLKNKTKTDMNKPLAKFLDNHVTYRLLGQVRDIEMNGLQSIQAYA